MIRESRFGVMIAILIGRVNNMQVIGIDAGKQTGIGVVDGGVLKHVFTTDFWGAIYFIDDHPKALFVVELPRKKDGKTNKSVWHNEAKSKKAIQRTGVNVGGVLVQAELIAEYLRRKDYSYITMNPKGKRSAEYFYTLTGWKGRTNQHERDSALLALSVGFK